MTGDQWFALLIVVGGIYFITCSVRYREFFLYRWKARSIVNMMGETIGHGFYTLLGTALVVGGLLQALGIWVIE